MRFKNCWRGRNVFALKARTAFHDADQPFLMKVCVNKIRALKIIAIECLPILLQGEVWFESLEPFKTTMNCFCIVSRSINGINQHSQKHRVDVRRVGTHCSDCASGAHMQLELSKQRFADVVQGGWNVESFIPLPPRLACNENRIASSDEGKNRDCNFKTLATEVTNMFYENCG